MQREGSRMKKEVCSCLRARHVESLIQSAQDLQVSPIVKYSAFSLFADRFYPSLTGEGTKDAKSWLLRPLRKSNLQLFALVANPSLSFKFSIECVNICKSWKGDVSGRLDYSALSCAWKAPRALTGFLASTTHPIQCSSTPFGRYGRRDRLRRCVSKLGKIKCKDESHVQDVKADDLRQMFLSMTEEVRVIIVKLAERGNLEILFEEMKFISAQEAGKVMLLEKKIKKLKTIIFISCTLFVVFVVRIMK